VNNITLNSLFQIIVLGYRYFMEGILKRKSITDYNISIYARLAMKHSFTGELQAVRNKLCTSDYKHIRR
jgi:hypothetical protein